MSERRPTLPLAGKSFIVTGESVELSHPCQASVLTACLKVGIEVLVLPSRRACWTMELA